MLKKIKCKFVYDWLRTDLDIDYYYAGAFTVIRLLSVFVPTSMAPPSGYQIVTGN